MWRNTLRRIPGAFARLVYLSSLKDAGTCRYSHPGLAQLFSGEEIDRTLRSSHHEGFTEWLTLALEEQKRDLDDFLDTERGATATLAAPMALIPGEAGETERRLFAADLEICLELLRIDSIERSRAGI